MTTATLSAQSENRCTPFLSWRVWLPWCLAILIGKYILALEYKNLREVGWRLLLGVGVGGEQQRLQLRHFL